MNSIIKKTNAEKLNTIIYVAAISLLTSLSASNNSLRVGNTGPDSSVFNYMARVILNGGMPYRDSFDHKGPLIYLIDALGLLIDQQNGVWIIELISVFCILFYSFKIAKLLGCGKKSSLVTVATTALGLVYYFDAGNLTEEYACVFIILSLYVFLNFFLRSN